MPRARRELAALPTPVQRRVAVRLDALGEQPRPPGAELLAGSPNNRIWRIRAGDYRILYEIRDDHLVVLVVRIGHRRDVYR